jgi:hypothetical protein
MRRVFSSAGWGWGCTNENVLTPEKRQIRVRIRFYWIKGNLGRFGINIPTLPMKSSSDRSKHSSNVLKKKI